MINGKPRAILFDLDGTLLLSDHSPAEQFILFCARLGHLFDDDAPRRLERWQHEYWSKRHQVDADLAEHGKDKFWLAYSVQQMQFLGVSGPLDDYSLKLEEWFRDEFIHTPVVPDDVRPTLTHLHNSGITLGLVSNRASPLDTVTAEIGLTDLFDFTLSAAQAASWKPEAEIFLKAVHLAKATPDTAVYIGDNYFADIVGARNAGLIPILIDRRNIFPDADCRIIRGIGELMSL
ncbi:MAG: HAD family hydrolase [Chloroflexi bacterium]|nr:HAD family hydrolase [Chloroflexota bacterium]